MNLKRPPDESSHRGYMESNASLCGLVFLTFEAKPLYSSTRSPGPQICVPAASWGELCLQNRWFFFPNKNRGLLVHRDLKHLGLDDGWELGWFPALAWSPWPEDQIRRLSRSSKNNNRHGYYRTCLRSIAPLMEERPYNIPSTQIYINDVAHQ